MLAWFLGRSLLAQVALVLAAWCVASIVAAVVFAALLTRAKARGGR